MDYSSGTKSLLLQLASWVSVAGLAAVFAFNLAALQDAAPPGIGDAATAAMAPAQPAAPSAASTVELRVGSGGHYQARADINGRSIPVLVDTGASIVVLTYEDARRAGIHLRSADFTQPASTANGVTRLAPVTLDRVSIGDITVRNVRAAVAGEGRLQMTLLGMSFLNQLERVDLRDGIMVLKD